MKPFPKDFGGMIEVSEMLKWTGSWYTYEKIHTGDWLSTWHFHEYRVRYRAENGATSVGIIRFKNDGTSDDFKRDFQDWTGEIIRTVGPAIKIVE